MLPRIALGEDVLERLTAVVSLVVVGTLWEMVCRFGWVSPLLISPPSEIFSAWLGLWRSGGIAGDLFSTLSAFGISLALSFLFGLLFGISMGMSHAMYHLIHPYIVSLNSVPKIALMPIVALWFGLGLSPKVFLGTLMGCFPIAMAVYAGVRSLERDTLLVARSFGAGRAMILRTVVLPGLLPHVLSALRVAVNYVFVGILTVEFFAADRGLGYKMVLYSANFETSAFFALLFTVIVAALLCSFVIHLAEARLIHWKIEE